MVCLTAIIRKDCPQLLSWKGESNVSGAEAVLRIIARILRNEDEAGGLVIGDLIISLLRRAGDSVVPVLPDLLRAMLSCITKAKTATFLQVWNPLSSISASLTLSPEPYRPLRIPHQQSKGQCCDPSRKSGRRWPQWSRYLDPKLV